MSICGSLLPPMPEFNQPNFDEAIRTIRLKHSEKIANVIAKMKDNVMLTAISVSGPNYGWNKEGDHVALGVYRFKVEYVVNHYVDCVRFFK